jgi:hypothetical protein
MTDDNQIAGQNIERLAALSDGFSCLLERLPNVIASAAKQSIFVTIDS